MTEHIHIYLDKPVKTKDKKSKDYGVPGMKKGQHKAQPQTGSARHATGVPEGASAEHTHLSKRGYTHTGGGVYKHSGQGAHASPGREGHEVHLTKGGGFTAKRGGKVVASGSGAKQLVSHLQQAGSHDPKAAEKQKNLNKGWENLLSKSWIKKSAFNPKVKNLRKRED